jgi:UDP-N-acetyl-D-glucosamine dehydrogenase
MEALNERRKALKGARVLVLGIAYKKDIDDMRESPSFHIIELLQKKGAMVDYNDPYVPKLPKLRGHDLSMDSVELNEDMLSSYDCVLIITDHSAYDYKWIVEHSRLIVDTRNAAAPFSKEVVKA